MTRDSQVFCNSGPLIALGKLNRLDLLESVFGRVTMPRAAFEDVVIHGLARAAADAEVVKTYWRRKEWPIRKVSSSR